MFVTPSPLPSRILVLGDVMLDLYTRGKADRISPEAPVLVLKAQSEEARLGGAGAVAALLASLGSRPNLIGAVGNDGPARVVRRLVAELTPSATADGLTVSRSCALLTASDRPTTVKERLIGQTANRHGQQLLRVDRESCEPLPDLLEEKLCVAALAALDEIQAVLISDYGKGVCSAKLLSDLIRAASNRSLPILVDPRRGADYATYRGATLIKPNRDEAGEATGRQIRSRADAIVAGRELCARYDFRAAVITLDADGMVLVTADGAQVQSHFPTRDREVADVTGAGDTVLAALGMALAGGLDLVRACELATAAAGLQVERLGVAAISWHELPLPLGEAPAEGGRNPENGPPATTDPSSPAIRALPGVSAGVRILTLDELLPIAGAARTDRTVVFTNGCFDLLHAGHVHCLTAAKALGNVLVVGINSDASVRRLKGPSRPIVGERERAAMLAALACVDCVVIFDDDTPEQLVAELRPDVLVKGAETRPGPIPGASIVASYGGRIELVPTLPGISTTALVDHILHLPPLPPGEGWAGGGWNPENGHDPPTTQDKRRPLWPPTAIRSRSGLRTPVAPLPEPADGAFLPLSGRRTG